MISRSCLQRDFTDLLHPPRHLCYLNDSSGTAVASRALMQALARRGFADHYRKTIGLDCIVLPNLVDLDRVRVERHEPKYVTFVNPAFHKGVYASARIVDELGRRRPEIPLLVVESCFRSFGPVGRR
jgi:hypothetical protein